MKFTFSFFFHRRGSIEALLKLDFSSSTVVIASRVSPIGSSESLLLP